VFFSASRSEESARGTVVIACSKFLIQKEKHMHNAILKLYLQFQNLTKSEEGQDLVEYALLVALVALAAITGVNKVASAVTTVFSQISASLA
jgi:pilus assembly protein Flp/PilA